MTAETVAPAPTRTGRRLMWTAVVAAVISVLVYLVVAAPKSEATDPRTQAAVTAWLAAHPGGERAGSNEIAYLHGTFVDNPGVVTVRRAGAAQAVADCPDGWLCFYQRPGFGYPRLRIHGCGWRDLAWWGFDRQVRAVDDRVANAKVTLVHHEAGTPHWRDTPVLVLDATAPVVRDTSTLASADYVYTACP